MTKIILRSLICLLLVGFAGCKKIANVISNVDGTGSSETTTHFVISSFGSPSVSGAIEDKSVAISDFKMNGQKGCSWKFSKGDISKAWGIGKDEIALLAVAGWQTSNGDWKCGKFEWSRPSNTSRDFKNINAKYNCWNPTEFYAAKKHCFFLMTKDAKKRTNIITD